MCIKCATELLMDSERTYKEYCDLLFEEDKRYELILEMKNLLTKMEQYEGIECSGFFTQKYHFYMESMRESIEDYEKRNFMF